MTQSALASCAPKSKPAERGKLLIDAWRQSGLSQATYARQHRIGTHLLVYWSKKFPRPGEAIPGSGTAGPIDSSNSAADFIQLPVTLPARLAPAAQPHIEIRLVSGALVRVTSGVDRALLTVVLQTLAGSAC
jgi:hypothetical protein